MELQIKEKKQSICLNMIVKNESHIIEETLEKLTAKIKFDYWCISDTGSTDNTKEIITNFFSKKNIPGELVCHEWQDFGYNRTKAIECAYNKTDYLLVFDADDELCGDFVLPSVLTADGYRLNFGDENGVSYIRVLLVNNRKKWCYKCVLHEYIQCLDPICNMETIVGNYYVISGRKGARSKDPNKYLNDAKVLEKAHAKALVEKDDLYIRYAFYCANSYLDCQRYEDAIKWYKITLSQPNWVQEKYISCLRLFECNDKLKQRELGMYYLIESRKYDNTRVECIFNLVNHYCCADMHDMALLYYSLVKHWYENEFLKIKDFSSYLFLSVSVYNFFLAYYMIIVYAKLNRYEEGLVMYEIICNKKYVDCTDFFINSLLSNFRLYIPTFVSNNWNIKKKITFLTNMLSYIELIILKNIPVKFEFIESIEKLINDLRPMLTSINTNLPKMISNKNNINVFLSITTCKRIDLFKQTINSILNTWLDIDKVDYFLCVDDNSSTADREYMQTTYPFFNFYLKTPEEKGHRESMNIIWRKLNKLKPKYWVHLEDDWLFFKEDNYIQKSINILETHRKNNIHQILFNRNYAETYLGWNINGGRLIDNGVLEHVKTDKIVGINCAYWPHYSFRPSMVNVDIILELGNFNTPNNFFERDYADNYFAKGYKSAFFNCICSMHIGKLTSDKSGTNAYTLNELEQFNTGNKEKKNDIFGNNIQIINLKRRTDRKETMSKLLEKHKLTKYTFVEAVDGTTLELTYDIYKLFKGNDFENRKGYIGCAMTHYNLWKKFIESKEEYVIIFEDDISLSINIADKIDQIIQSIPQFKQSDKSLDILFLGHSVFPSFNSDKIAKIQNNDMVMIDLNKQKYIGGFFGYIITQSGAKKMIDYIEKNGIKHGIDYLIKINDDINAFNIQPHIIFSECVNEYTNNRDSDIQLKTDKFDFNIVNKDEWEYYPMLDNNGDDIVFIGKHPIETYMENAFFNKKCVAFNTLGFLKHNVDVNNLVKSGYFKQNDGIYIKKSIKKQDNITMTENSKVVVKDTNVNKMIRVKMMCNWCSSKQLCNEWNKMTKGNFTWNTIQFTWENTNIDYYVIINKPPANEYYEPSKTIVFQMEPWCYDESQKWGVKTWGEWAEPDETKFLQVRSHKKYYNNGFWQLKSTYTELKSSKLCKANHNIISTICTSKYFDPGHIKRIDFLKYMEKQNDPSVVFHLYNEDNHFNFKNYMGKARPDIDKEVGIMNYKYYFMCENNQEYNFMTEKIWEPLLCNCLCFYWGCPNLSDYINPLAYIELDMNDFEKSFKIVKHAIENNLWEERLPIIYAEKQKVLDYYNFCPTIERILLPNNNYDHPVKKYRHSKIEELNTPPITNNTPISSLVGPSKVYNNITMNNIQSSEEEKYKQVYKTYLLDTITNSPTYIQNICFIHSCTLRVGGTESLDNILNQIQKSGLFDMLDLIVINNIGIELDVMKYEFGGKIKVINYSENTQLFEIPTLQLMHHFSQDAQKTNILYLHTKGVCYENNKQHPIYNNVQDWIHFMLYFVVYKYKDCVELLKIHDSVGVNYSPRNLSNPNSHNHWSGNFWWATSNHIKRLDVTTLTTRHSAEWWCLSLPNIKIANLHTSNVDHYQNPYKPDKYVKF
jgi:GR25 family glycosyltransferase involved in LPS biosynthesis